MAAEIVDANYWGTFPLQNSERELANCAQKRFPVDWWNQYKPNRYTNAVGREPGYAHVLILLRDLTRGSINLDEPATLKLGTNEHSVTINNMYYVERTCITPGDDEDEDACYLVTLADKRIVARWRACNHSGTIKQRQYNMRAPASAVSGAANDYYRDTSNGADPRTWQEIVNALAGDVDLFGATLTLPYTPDPRPENLGFYGNAWDALNDVIEKIGCGFAWESSAATASIVRPGDTQTGLAGFYTAWAKHKIFDSAPHRSERAWAPSQVFVNFPRIAEHYGTEQQTQADAGSQHLTAAIHSETVSAATAGFTVDAQASSAAVLWDSYQVRYNYAGTIIAGDQTIATARATNCAKEFYKNALSAASTHRIYRGCLSDFEVGSQVWKVSWSVVGNAPTTEVWSAPSRHAYPADAVSRKSVVDWQAGPDFNRFTTPLYPFRAQAIRISSISVSTSPAGLYTGYRQRINPDTPAKEDKEEVRVWFMDSGIEEAAGVLPFNSPRVGDVVMGLLVGTDTVGANVYPIYVACQSPTNFFPAKITATGSADSKDRYTYTISEIEYTANTAGYDQMATKSGGRSGSAYNFLEDGNVNNGKHMNGVTESNLPAGFTIQAVPVNAMVIAWEMKRHSAGTVTSDYWFFCPQGVDGTCATSGTESTKIAEAVQHVNITQTPWESLSSNGNWKVSF